MIRWDSSENHFLLNPRLPESEKQRLMGLVNQVSEEFKGHIFILSSGTTQTSQQNLKWVALSKDAFLCAAQAVNEHLSVKSQDHWLQLLPTFHVGGLAIWARSFLSRAKVSSLSIWNVDQVVRLIEESFITHVSLVPAQIFDLVQAQKLCPKSIRFVLVGAGALSPDLYLQARKLGWPLLSTYGMTEMCSSIAITDPAGMNEDSFQKLRILPHVNVRQSIEGLLEMKSAALFTGYVEEDIGAQAQIKASWGEGGWFTTSDRGVLEGSSLRLLGRSADFIKIGGESVELHRLNSHLERIRIELKLTADVALVPYPDDRLNHVIHLVSDNQLTVDEFEKLRQIYNTCVLPFEKIRHWHILPQIPRTELKKFKLSECLQMLKSIH